jgi:hypothetical protein
MQHIISSKAYKKPTLALDRRFSYGKVESNLPIITPRTPFSLDPSNGVLLVSLWDVQECARSNMALLALFSSLLRVEDLGQDAGAEECEKVLQMAAMRGTGSLKEELTHMLDLASDNASPEERMYLPIIRDRIENGSLGETLPPLVEEKGFEPVLEMLSKSLRTNRPFLAPGRE